MRAQVVSKLAAVFAVLFVVAIWALPGVNAQNLTRLVAEFKNFDNTETSTTNGVCNPVAGPCGSGSSTGAMPGNDGFTVYTKPFFVPGGQITAYFTFSAVADTHDGVAEWLSCRLDGAFCNPGPQGAGQPPPPGWIAVKKLPNAGTNCNDGGGGSGDCHDNSISVTWCMPITGGVHTIELKMASSFKGHQVFFQGAHFYLDTSDATGPTCQAATGAL